MAAGPSILLAAASLLCVLAGPSCAQDGEGDPVSAYATEATATSPRPTPGPRLDPRPNLLRVCRIEPGTPPLIAAGGSGALRLTVAAQPGFALSADASPRIGAEASGLAFGEARTAHRSAPDDRGLDWVVVTVPVTAAAGAQIGEHVVRLRTTARVVRSPSGEDLGWMTDTLETSVRIHAAAVRALQSTSSRRALDPTQTPTHAFPGAQPMATTDLADETARDLLCGTVVGPASPAPMTGEPLKPSTAGPVALLVLTAFGVLLFRNRNAVPSIR